MADVPLQHCVPVVVYGPLPPPKEVTLDLTAGGEAGDGVVEITAGPGQLPGPVSVPTGSTGSYPFSGVTLLKLHYRQSAGGPDSVTASVEVS